MLTKQLTQRITDSVDDWPGSLLVQAGHCQVVDGLGGHLPPLRHRDRLVQVRNYVAIVTHLLQVTNQVHVLSGKTKTDGDNVIK